MHIHTLYIYIYIFFFSWIIYSGTKYRTLSNIPIIVIEMYDRYSTRDQLRERLRCQVEVHYLHWYKQLLLNRRPQRHERDPSNRNWFPPSKCRIWEYTRIYNAMHVRWLNWCLEKLPRNQYCNIIMIRMRIILWIHFFRPFRETF